MVPDAAGGSGPYAHLAGYAFPGGRIELTPHVAWLWAECVTAAPGGDVAHPSTGWLLAMRGCGMSLDDLFALLDATAESGVVLGEAELELHRPLRVRDRYDASASVLDVTRKSGRRSGALDLLRLRLELRQCTDGLLAFSLVNTMVFPRGADA